jgi:outer membrane receptor protein involved in Fe transport
MRRILFIAILLFAMANLFAQQTGNLAGRVSETQSGKPIGNAAVFIEGTSMGTYSAENGSFYIRDIPVGIYQMHVSFMGYKKEVVEVTVVSNETTTQNVQLQVQAVQIEGMRVSATRAVPRETPVSFTDVSEEEIQEKYTTGDMPQMLDDIPGLFSTTSGLGEAEITMRGFDAEKIQILVNGVPVNDPESQIVYWSNWTGLSSNVKSVQVQRGAGASLYGSGALGGSVNIETMGSERNQEFIVRTSGGLYTTDGKSADGKGEIAEYKPYNYNFMLKYSSGNLFNDKFKFNLTAERKAGDYYIRGTEYDGWSFGFETENKFKNRVINTSFIAAPQKHNQARSTYDRELGKFLGREFSYTTHPWQENFYVKPQFSIRDRWTITPQSTLMTNIFFTMGDGGLSYANNIRFNAENGEMIYRDLLSETSERRNFANYAYYVYQETGYSLDGFTFDEATTGGTYEWAGGTKTVYSGSNFIDGDGTHTWKVSRKNVHKQGGINSYYETDLTDNLNVILGAESRYWVGDHYLEGSEFRHFNPEYPDEVSTFGAFYREYDYTTTVINSSGFARSKITIPFEKGIENINIMIDGQYAIYHSKVDENMIHFYDFNQQKFLDVGYYSSKNDSILVWQHDTVTGDSSQVTVAKFSDDDYKRTFTFFSPKFGANVNLNEQWNVLANYSIVYKEPKVTEWYNRSSGPSIDSGKIKKIKPEKAQTIEGGVGFSTKNIKTDITYYRTHYKDKIEYVSIGSGEQATTATINIGRATHQGIEYSFSGKFGDFDTKVSATFSRNRWGKLPEDYNQIFYENAEDVEGKVVPFSPEKMATAGIGYSFRNMPLLGSLRIGIDAKWMDDYYATYDNIYCKQLYYYDEDGNFQSIGEHHFIENLDGEGRYDYNEASGEYVINYQNQGDYDREWIMRSSKLPTFFELNGSLSYKFFIGGKEAAIKVNVNNILNRNENYSKAAIQRAYGMALPRKDDDGNITSWADPTFGEGATSGNYEGSGHYPYLSPSPLLNVFVTLEFKF